MPDISETIEKLKLREERINKRIEKLKTDLDVTRGRLRDIKKRLRAAEREAKKK